MPAAALNTFIAGSDVAGFLSALFAGNDSVTGSPSNDHLLG
jgi:hypothetical protein